MMTLLENHNLNLEKPFSSFVSQCSFWMNERSFFVPFVLKLSITNSIHGTILTPCFIDQHQPLISRRVFWESRCLHFVQNNLLLSRIEWSTKWNSIRSTPTSWNSRFFSARCTEEHVLTFIRGQKNLVLDESKSNTLRNNIRWYTIDCQQKDFVVLNIRITMKN